MQAVHRIFQMIFGIVVSVTILFFLLTYSGNYASVQKDKQRADILTTFGQDARSVYLTGISENFTYFSKYDFSSCFMNSTGNSVPEMVCTGSTASGIPMETPVIFKPGSQVYIARDSLDYGWWTFGAAEALPDTVFVFTPVDNSQASWDLMTSMVQHLPDTSDDWSVVRVTFAFCDGSRLLYVCGGRPCSKLDFLSIISSGPMGAAFSPCTANSSGKAFVTISSACGGIKGVCINPPDPAGVGNAFVEGSARAFVYKDPLDLVSLAMGGTQKDDFGVTGAERIFDYKNSVLMPRLSMAAQVMSKRSVLISGKSTAGCGAAYTELAQVLDKVPSSQDYSSISQMHILNGNLNQAKGIYQSLLDLGCERVEYGL